MKQKQPERSPVRLPVRLLPVLLEATYSLKMAMVKLLVG